MFFRFFRHTVFTHTRCIHWLTGDCIRLTDIAPAKCQQTRYRSEFTAASRGFPATAWLSCQRDNWMWAFAALQDWLWVHTNIITPVFFTELCRTWTSPLCPSWSARCASVSADNLQRTFVHLYWCVEQSVWFTQRHCSVTTLFSESPKSFCSLITNYTSEVSRNTTTAPNIGL